MESIRRQDHHTLRVPETWFGFDGLTAEQIGRQIATASAKIEALTAELARRAKGEDREVRQ